jgi:hypothetical protein
MASLRTLALWLLLAAAWALEPFALVHLSHAPAGPGVESAAKALGFLVQNGRIGTAEGHAVRDLNGWIAAGDFDLAVLAFVREGSAAPTATGKRRSSTRAPGAKARGTRPTPSARRSSA